MVKLSAAAIVFFLCATVNAACGGSPTTPEPVQVRANNDAVVVPTPAPTPAPEPPAAPAPESPAPAPMPAPSPGPGPAPAPVPDPVETWQATVAVQRASVPTAQLPSAFAITVRGTTIQFGPFDATILSREGAHLYARKGVGLTIEIHNDDWTLTSVDVFATGKITY